MDQPYKPGLQLVARLLLVVFLLESCYNNTSLPLSPQVSKEKKIGGRHLELAAIHSIATLEGEYESSKSIVIPSELEITSSRTSSGATNYAEASVAITMHDSPICYKDGKGISESMDKVALPGSFKKKSITEHKLTTTYAYAEDSKSIQTVIEPQLEKAFNKIIEKENIRQTRFTKLTDKQFIAQGGHAVRFYEEAGKLQANVEESLPAGFSRKHKGLPVYLAADMDITKVASLSEEAQKRLIEVHLPKSSQPGHVYLGKRGLLGGMKEGKEIPDECLCPITHEIMEDPVIAQDGHTYERAAIQRWLDMGHRNSPLSGNRLLSNELISNYTLRSLIKTLKEQIPVLARHQLNMDHIEAVIKLREEEMEEKLLQKGHLVNFADEIIRTNNEKKNDGLKELSVDIVKGYC